MIDPRATNGTTRIAGIGQTPYAKWGTVMDRSEMELCCEAIVNACDDAGMSVDEIDGFCSFGDDRNQPSLVAHTLGVPGFKFASMVWSGGGGGSASAMLSAVLAVHSGICRAVVVYRAICQGQFERYGQFRPRPLSSFAAPFGLHSPPNMAAMMTRRYMYETGTTKEQLGDVALAFRRHANRNPRALFANKTLDMEQYMAAREIASPFSLYDCCVETDGACAVIVTSPERARDGRQRPVSILAAAQGSGPRFGLGLMGSWNMPAETFATLNSKEVSDQIWGISGLTPKDVDVAQFYDAFTSLVPMALEEYGFCKRGEGGPFVAEGNLNHDGGSLPSNTAGGLLSEAYQQGMNLIVEGVRQMRGSSTSQVENAEVCLVTSGANAPHTSGLLLGRC